MLSVVVAFAIFKSLPETLIYTFQGEYLKRVRVLGFYVERDTPVRKLAPFTKLMYAVTSTVVTFLFPSFAVGILFLVLSVFLNTIARVLKHLIALLMVVSVSLDIHLPNPRHVLRWKLYTIIFSFGAYLLQRRSSACGCACA